MPSIPLKVCKRIVESDKPIRVGNHASVDIHLTKGKGSDLVAFIYHSSKVCVVNDDRREFFTDTCGWDTTSTRWAIESYRQLLVSLGYMEVTKKDAIDEGWW